LHSQRTIKMNKREFLKTAALGSLTLLIKPNSLTANLPVQLPSVSLDEGKNGFKLPDLGFSFNALEPYIDARTMEIHYSKHHAGYVFKLNEAVKDTKLARLSLEHILSKIKATDTAVRNNGGGHYNHSLFWRIISPNPIKEPIGNLSAAIERDFGSFEKMKAQFDTAAKSRFGSGWAWLISDKKGKLRVTSTPNQDNPLMTKIATDLGTPIINLDVWEHAYYLKYQNKRADYVTAFWSLTNWAEAEKLYNER
jgi:Fe-Mn family superoxide dismutase